MPGEKAEKAEKANTSPPSRLLGRELKKLREAAGLSLDDAAAELMIARTTIYRGETGKVGARKDRDIIAMCRLYGANEERTQALLKLAREARTKGWWTEFDIPDYLALHIAMEAAAREIWWFEPTLCPALLQNEDYARAVIAAQANLTPGATASSAKFRLSRQAVLSRAERPATLRVIMAEEVLRRPIGGAAVQAAQLERVLQAADLPNVSVRIVPVSIGMYPGVGTGPFEMLHFWPDSDGILYEDPTVYAEGFVTSGGDFDNPADVSRYQEAYEAIESCALSETDSNVMIKQSMEALRS